MKSKSMKRFAVTLSVFFSLAGLLGQMPTAVAFEWSDLNPIPRIEDTLNEHAKETALRRAKEAEQRAKEAELAAEKARKKAEIAKRTAEQKARRAGSSDKASAPIPMEHAQPVAQEPPVSSPSAASEKKVSLWNPMTWFVPDEPDNKAKAQRQKDEPVNTLATAAPAHEAQSSAEKVQNAQEKAQKQYLDQARKMRAAVLETQRGSVTFELYPDEAPQTVANFVRLTQEGFYNQPSMKFHRVVPGFVVQTGDPTGTGAGGSKERIPLEVKNKLSHDAKGVVAMARGAAPNSASSQFYITLAPQKTLDAKYAIFGRVISGADVLDKIEKDDKVYGVKLVDIRTVTRDVNASESKGFFKKLL